MGEGWGEGDNLARNTAQLSSHQNVTRLFQTSYEIDSSAF